jgi:hypothetical protein
MSEDTVAEPSRKRRSTPTKLNTSLQLQLQALSMDAGILSEDLPELLENELNDLGRFWELELGPKTDLADLQKQVRTKLIGHLTKITLHRTSRERRRKFELAFALGFNLHTYPGAHRSTKAARQKLIEKPDRDGITATLEMARRDLLNAYAAIEKQILDTGFDPQVPVSVFKKDVDRDEQGVAEAESSSDPDESTVVPEVKPFWRRRRILLAVALGVTLALAVTVGTMVVFRDEASLDPQSLLRATILSTGTDSAYGGIFPSQLKAKAGGYVGKLSNSPNTANYEQIFQDELSDGAYAAGGVRVNITLEVLVDGEVSLYDIKPVHVKREPVPLDTLVLLSLGHGPSASIQISLDQAVPVAMDVGSGQPKRFGSAEMMGLSKGSKGTLDVAFNAQTVAETFDVALSYEYQGKRYTQVLHRTPDGQPFRAAALLCNDRLKAPASEVSSAELERLRTLRYRSVVGLDPTINAAGNYAVKTIDPDDFAARCY